MLHAYGDPFDDGQQAGNDDPESETVALPGKTNGEIGAHENE